MTLSSRCSVRIDVDVLVYSILLNIPINYHPMNLLPTFAPTSTLNSNYHIADPFTKPLSCHRFDTLIGDILHTAVDPPSTASTALVVTPTVAVIASTTTTSASDSDQTLHPNLVSAPTPPIVLDTGASFSLTPFAADFLPVNQAPYLRIDSVCRFEQFCLEGPCFHSS